MMRSYEVKNSPLTDHLIQCKYFYASVTIHIIIFSLLFQDISTTKTQSNYKNMTASQKSILNQKIEKSNLAKMRTQIDNLKKIKDILERSIAENQSKQKSSVPSSDPDAEKIYDEKELLAKAQKLENEIEKISIGLRATELSKILKIPKEKVVEKLREEKKNDSVKENKSAMTIGNRIDKLEAKSKMALKERIQQLDREQNGVDIGGTWAGEAMALSAGHLGGGDGSEGGAGDNSTGFWHKSQITDKHMNDFFNDFTEPPNDELWGNYNGTIPPVKQPVPFMETAKSIGIGGEYSNRLYLNSWYVIGPFSEDAHAPPEYLTDLNAIYIGKNNSPVQWEYVTRAEYPFFMPEEDDSVFYGYTEIRASKEMDVDAWLGADDVIQVWLNDRLIYAGGSQYSPPLYNHTHEWVHWVTQWNLTAVKRRVHLNKGINKIRFRFFNYTLGSWISVVLSPVQVN